eukprot:PhF_6_TR11563/c0_g1_i1/m.18640
MAELHTVLIENTTAGSELPYFIKRSIIENVCSATLLNRSLWGPTTTWDKATAEKNMEALFFFKLVFEEILPKATVGMLKALVSGWREEYVARSNAVKLGTPKPPPLAADSVLEKVVLGRLSETLGAMTTKTFKDLKMMFGGEKSK